MRKLLQYSIYYCILAVTLWVFFLDLSFSLHTKAFISISIGGLFIALGEYLLPFRKEWKGFRRDSLDDVYYMIFVQQVLLRLVQAAWVYFILVLLSLNPQSWSAIWNPIPLFFQFSILLLIGEFGKYWVHRWAHEREWLWRFHAVHHSVERIYWLNVGRFHPVDKFLQMFTESLLFYFMGAPLEVVALYEVFYSVNGFFQHSNIDLRLGFLNRLISSVEQHRFHHSRMIAESNTNYGNKLSIYDQLFGTYFLPNSKGPKEYGLISTTYPMSFWQQLWSPFFKGLDQNGFLVENPFRFLVLRELIVLRIRVQGWLCVFKFWLGSRDLKKTQVSLLKKILHQQSKTEFGVINGFSKIQTLDDFKANVKIQNYEDLRPFLMKQESEGIPSLISEKIIFYAVTSGTTGQPKLIPITKHQLKRYRVLQAFWIYFVHAECPSLFDGHVLSIVGDAIEGTLPSGRNFGSTSGHIYHSLPHLVRGLYVLPPEVFSIKDHQLKYLLIVRLAAENKFISFISTANPSTFNMLQKVANTYGQQLVNDIKEGSFYQWEHLSSDLKNVLHKRFQINPSRATELQQLYDRTGQLLLEEIWPSLKVVACWQSAGCHLAFETFKKSFKSKKIQWRDIGYLSSEFRGTIPMRNNAAEGLPTYLDYFYEFIPMNQLDEENPQTLGLWELKEGEKYSILVTSFNGLYRYFMNDIVEVAGFSWKVPLLRFVQKGRGVTSITGEKLYESQFLTAVKNCNLNNAKSRVQEALALADIEKSTYLVLIEQSGLVDKQNDFTVLLDQEISKINIEYKSKRESGRLNLPRVVFMKAGFFDELRSSLATKNSKGRDAQVKIIAVQYLHEFSMDWNQWVLP